MKLAKLTHAIRFRSGAAKGSKVRLPWGEKAFGRTFRRIRAEVDEVDDIQSMPVIPAKAGIPLPFESKREPGVRRDDGRWATIREDRSDEILFFNEIGFELPRGKGDCPSFPLAADKWWLSLFFTQSREAAKDAKAAR